VIAAIQSKHRHGLTLGIQRHTGQCLAVVVNGDGSARRQTIFAGYGYRNSGLRASALVACLRGQLVCVAWPCALSAATANAGIASASPNPATNSSRRPRQ